MIGSAQTLAWLITLGSLAFALVMVIALGVLIARRWVAEREASARATRALAVSRDLLGAISGGGETNLPAFNAARPGERLLALSHLVQLLRGGDRDRLLALAEQRGLFGPALVQLRRGAAARRIDAMRVLEQFGSQACIAGLQAALERDQNDEVRLEAAATLARLGQLPAIAETIRLLNLDRAPRTRIHTALFRSLAQRDMTALAQLAGDPPYAGLRAELVDALGWSGDFAILPVLAGHAEDPNAEVRAAALRAARRLGHPDAGRWAARLLDDFSEHVRIQAARTCGTLGAREAGPRLRKLADDPSWWVRTRAADALNLLASRVPA